MLLPSKTKIMKKQSFEQPTSAIINTPVHQQVDELIHIAQDIQVKANQTTRGFDIKIP